MIEDPPLLTVQRPSRRPTEAQIAAFQGVPTSIVVDAMQGGQVLDRQIRPLGEERGFAITGPALTADNGPADILALFAALKFLAPGDVLVSAVSGHQGCAAMGDRVAGFAKNAGAVGIVTDGPARDFAGLQEVGLPVWCTGLCPNTPYGNGPGKVGMPIQIGGQRVETGDMIVADFDGVAVVPFARLDEVVAKVQVVIELEAALEGELRQGLSVPPATEALLRSDRVKYLD